MKATDFSAALAGHASGRFSEGFSLRRSQPQLVFGSPYFLLLMERPAALSETPGSRAAITNEAILRREMWLLCPTDAVPAPKRIAVVDRAIGAASERSACGAARAQGSRGAGTRVAGAAMIGEAHHPSRRAAAYLPRGSPCAGGRRSCRRRLAGSSCAGDRPASLPAEAAPPMPVPRRSCPSRILCPSLAPRRKGRHVGSQPRLLGHPLTWTLAIFGPAASRSGMDPEGRLGGNVVERLVERHGDDAERA